MRRDSGPPQFGPADFGPRPTLGYTNSPVDRAAERRTDAVALAAFAADPAARAYVIGGELIVLNKAADGPDFTIAEARALGAVADIVFLGVRDGTARFGMGMERVKAEGLVSRSDLLITDLRSIAVQGLASHEHLPPIAEAKALLHWHARHRFCSACGAPTQMTEGGWKRHCPSCGVEHFPRTDPVVIMLAVQGARCLLGRSPRFAPTMWSCLAGFVEPGETIEEAVRRETLEEVGIVCGRVSYFASQPWPFPSSLMIGCHAEAVSDTVAVDRAELEDARWFSRDEAAAMLLRAHPGGLSIPPPVAIAYHIIRAWLEDGVAFR